MSPDKPRRLGRGLEALLAGANPVSKRDNPPVSRGDSAVNEFRQIPMDRIRPNPFQPRHEFAETELNELKASLAASGMLQPVVVRSVGNEFELISGERRYRAAGQLGWQQIPALVREADERTMLTLALIENLQRSDLSAVEEARGYHQLHEEFALTHQQIAEAVGKDRSTISNLLRLLTLPVQVQGLLEHASLTMGHARALLGMTDQKMIVLLAKEIVAGELSVRETERRVRLSGAPSDSSHNQAVNRSKNSRPTTTSDPATRRIEDSLRKRYQTDVHLQINPKGQGSIQLSFYSTDDLNRLLDLLSKQSQIGD